VLNDTGLCAAFKKFSGITYAEIVQC